MLLLSHIRIYIIHPFPTFSLLFLTFFLINISTYYYTFFNFSPPFYLFIFPLLYTLISLFLYLFIFLYFLLFLSLPLTINLQFSLSFYTYFPTHKRLLSLSKNFVFYFFGGIFYFSALFGTLVWVDIIKLCL